MNTRCKEGALIRDIPSYRKMSAQMRTFSLFKRAFPFLKPFLGILGVKVKEIEEALAGVDDLVRQSEELMLIPDRFNELFAERGWIIHDRMNLEVAKKAIEKADAGDYDAAETDLVEYYGPETVRWMLQSMFALKAFRPRMRLAEKALLDYEEQRYHACVPVVLALLDGLVNEVHEARRGFFAEGTDLAAWDSIAAHGSGLNTLAALFRKGRQKTTVEEIRIPFRNGIMHGTDLGYDNVYVAAKSWAALFATRDWAIRAESGLLDPPPAEPEPTWREFAGQLQEYVADKERLERWKPRSLRVGIEVPESGKPEAFTPGTPERSLAEYLDYWGSQNYGHMSRCLSHIWDPMSGGAPARVREALKAKLLKAFRFTSIVDLASFITEVEAEVVFEEDGTPSTQIVKFRLVNEDPKGDLAPRDKPGSRWLLMDWLVG